LERINEEQKKYEDSDKYKKLQDELKKKDDDDDFKGDTDPEGFVYYRKCLEDPMKKAFEVAKEFSSANI